jgi:hypothetical protein
MKWLSGANQYHTQSFAELLVKNTAQMKCLYKLYYAESRWDFQATNNGHYGIPQGKSVWLKDCQPLSAD